MRPWPTSTQVKEFYMGATPGYHTLVIDGAERNERPWPGRNRCQRAEPWRNLHARWRKPLQLEGGKDRNRCAGVSPKGTAGAFFYLAGQFTYEVTPMRL